MRTERDRGSEIRARANCRLRRPGVGVTRRSSGQQNPRTPGSAGIAKGPSNCGYLLKVALVDTFVLSVSVHTGLLPVQAPDQLANVLPEGGVAVSVTRVPGA